MLRTTNSRKKEFYLLAVLGCHNHIAYTGWLKKPKFISPQFWRLEDGFQHDWVLVRASSWLAEGRLLAVPSRGREAALLSLPLLKGHLFYQVKAPLSRR